MNTARALAAILLSTILLRSARADSLATAYDKAAGIKTSSTGAGSGEIARHLSRAVALNHEIRDELFRSGKRLDKKLVGEIHGSWSEWYSGGLFSSSGEGSGEIDGATSELTLHGGEFFSLLVRDDTAEDFINDPSFREVQDPRYPLQCSSQMQTAQAAAAKVLPFSFVQRLQAELDEFRAQMYWLDAAIVRGRPTGGQLQEFHDLRTWALGTKIYVQSLVIWPYQIVKYHYGTGASSTWKDLKSYARFDSPYGGSTYMVGSLVYLPGSSVTSDCNSDHATLDIISDVRSWDTVSDALRPY